MTICNRQLIEREACYSLRGIAMICIVSHHLWQFSMMRFCMHYLTMLGYLFQSLGYLCAGLFFLLSGYGLYCSLRRIGKITSKYVCSHTLIFNFLFDTCLIRVWTRQVVFTLHYHSIAHSCKEFLQPAVP